MRNFCFLIGAIVFLLLAGNLNTECSLPENWQDKCPTNTCATGQLMADNGQCYDCETSESVPVNCFGEKQAKIACPNRFIFQACQNYSVLACHNNIPNKCESYLYWLFPFQWDRCRNGSDIIIDIANYTCHYNSTR